MWINIKLSRINWDLECLNTRFLLSTLLWDIHTVKELFSNVSSRGYKEPCLDSAVFINCALSRGVLRVKPYRTGKTKMYYKQVFPSWNRTHIRNLRIKTNQARVGLVICRFCTNLNDWRSMGGWTYKSTPIFILICARPHFLSNFIIVGLLQLPIVSSIETHCMF